MIDAVEARIAPSLEAPAVPMPPLKVATIPRSTLVARGLWPLWDGLPVAHDEAGKLVLHPLDVSDVALCWTAWRREDDGAWRARCPHSCIRVEESLWCQACDRSPRWPDQELCYGCLNDHAKPCEVVPMLACHWDLGTAMASLRRRVVYWEEKHPQWILTPDYQRIWEESTAPTKYADRETTIGRKLVQARWRVERRHPRGHKRAEDRWAFPLFILQPGIGMGSRIYNLHDVRIVHG